ncbi:hypothetical protein DIE23_15610 [Burkholderia sp. Bp9143]|uniref:hypothetical protein n=1 Tax=Burkholderia sp. Bp9143 TaxID=2184574 RepID=UPI000F5AE84B|nr:hypothetical protein [Burkholderia sp. Bp9143]RQR32745.1 hypothetical protein DIE23_15610 [Burkholderia sp. Bp9143]
MTINNEVDIQELRQVALWLADADVEFAEIGYAGSTIRLTFSTGQPGDDAPGDADAAAAPSPAGAPASVVNAPSTGIWVATHPDRLAPQAAIGARVEAGSVVGLLQIAELYRPVVAACGGVISDALADEGDVVGYGTPLFELTAEPPSPTRQETERANDGN